MARHRATLPADVSSTTLFAYAIQANSSIAASNGNGVLERTSNSMQLRTTIGDPGVPAWIINTNSAFTSDILTLKNNGTSIATFTAAGALNVNVGGGGSKPTCDSSMRNAVWFVQGGAGVKDTYEVCAKDAADAYAWRTIY